MDKRDLKYIFSSTEQMATTDSNKFRTQHVRDVEDNLMTVFLIVKEIYGGTLSAPQYRPRLVPKYAPGYQF